VRLLSEHALPLFKLLLRLDDVGDPFVIVETEKLGVGQEPEPPLRFSISND
jgi:hypothetical protein